MKQIMTWIEREFELLATKAPDHLVLPFKDEIVKIFEKFADSGQSGGSAPHTTAVILRVLNKLLSQYPLTPLTGEDSEWNVLENGIAGLKVVAQNNRNSAVFKNRDGSCSFIHGIQFREPDGTEFSGWVEGINSSQVIRKFPSVPVTFYVDVVPFRNSPDTPEHPGKWLIALPEQLQPANEMYDLKLSEEFMKRTGFVEGSFVVSGSPDGVQQHQEAST